MKSVERQITSTDQSDDHSLPNKLEDTDTDTETDTPTIDTHSACPRHTKRKRGKNGFPLNKWFRTLTPDLSSSQRSKEAQINLSIAASPNIYRRGQLQIVPGSSALPVAKSILPSDTTSIETGHGLPPKLAATSTTFDQHPRGTLGQTELLPCGSSRLSSAQEDAYSRRQTGQN